MERAAKEPTFGSSRGLDVTIREYLTSIQLFFYTLTALFALRRPPTLMVFYRQVYFTGLEAFNRMALIAVFIGAVIIMQTSNIFGANAVLLGKILSWTVLRELGPLFAAVLVIARSGVAMTSELATMKLSGEIDTLKRMGINPIDYLIVPRITGCIVTLALLTVYLQAAAIFGGLILCSLVIEISIPQALSALVAAVELSDIFLSLMKSLMFGSVAGSIVCLQGLSVTSSITEIPQATIRAVMRSFLAVFVINGLITYLAFL